MKQKTIDGYLIKNQNNTIYVVTENKKENIIIDKEAKKCSIPKCREDREPTVLFRDLMRDVEYGINKVKITIKKV